MSIHELLISWRSAAACYAHYSLHISVNRICKEHGDATQLLTGRPGPSRCCAVGIAKALLYDPKIVHMYDTCLQRPHQNPI